MFLSYDSKKEPKFEQTNCLFESSKIVPWLYFCSFLEKLKRYKIINGWLFFFLNNTYYLFVD